MQGILECKDLHKSYSGTPALNGLNLSLPCGRIIGLLGPNGSGKTTLIKLAAGLLTPTSGQILVDGKVPGPETKAIVSYLPERPYFDKDMRINECLSFFSDFYADFDKLRAADMLASLNVPVNARIKSLSKGTQEKVQLVLVMSRRARLYLLDEPIGGVDPAARDYILHTILTNYNENSTILISTHLISDVEKVLDEFIFLREGHVVAQDTADHAREESGKSLDEVFREVFKC